MINNNNEFLVTARKWRPRNFSDVTSQEFIVTTLLNSVKNSKVSHAYLFTGPRGVGKTTIARLLAKAINCKEPDKNGEPCNNCDSCNEINDDNRNHPDVFEIDGASNRNIDDIRELKEKVKYGPLRSKYKVFIIDEVHMLTGASFNALLKTLEEPPHYVVFIFATTSPEKVPVTILGRCQRFDFKRISIEEIIGRLKYIAEKEKIKIDEESLFYISKKGDGSMRDAQGLFDMTAAYCSDKITFDKLKVFFNIAESDVFFKISGYIKDNNGKDLLKFTDELIRNGHSLETLLVGITQHYRNLLTAVTTGSADLISETENVRNRYVTEGTKYSELEILNSLKLILQTEYTFKYSFNQRTLFETLLIELIKFNQSKEISTILNELNDLKKNFDKAEITGTAEKTVPAEEEPVKKRSMLEIIEMQVVNEDKSFAHIEKVTAQQNEPLLNFENKTSDELWTALLTDVENEGRRWVYSLLKKSEFKLNNKTYEITISDDQFDMLTDYKEYIRDQINKYFSDKRSVSIMKKSQTDTSAAVSQDISNHDKIKKILIEDFKGKLLS